MPEQYDPAFDESVVTPFVQSMQPKAEAFTLKPGEARYEGDKKVAEAPPEVKEAPGFSLSPGEVRYDGSGNMVASRPAAPRAPREPRLERIETVKDGKAVYEYVEPKLGATYEKPTGAAKPASGQQRKALNFFNRGKESHDIAAALEEGGDVNALRIKMTPEWANFTQSNPNQAYVQSQRAFTEARLRKDSGAAVPDSEYEKDAVTFFKQPGDSPETIRQKRAMREATLAGIAFESGDALREFYGDESEGMLEQYRRGGQAARPRQNAPASAQGAARPATRAEFDALPSGATFIAPDGSRRRKP
jgi:hypothetical protein